MQWYLIDYGLILHKKYHKRKNEEEKKQEIEQLKDKYNDLALFLLQSIDMPIYNIVEKNNLKTESFEKLTKKIKASYDHKNIKKYLPNITEKNTLNICNHILFLIFYPIKYHEFMKIDTVKYEKYITKYSDSHKQIYSHMIKNINISYKIITFIKDNYM